MASIVVGVLFIDFSTANLIKAALAVVAQLLTSAVGSMAIARSGYLNGSPPTSVTHTDELQLIKPDGN
ncbi:monovalent cation/H(+) antiporter subunit G [Nesterenkonia pannonica]|uniref:monovalent cation/H(+) antiporter subunit G n=1 Tax=Nesterenkonia pannonica TaxID=1548602 RepID=UPI0021641D62|nr:monovalent cation/H(+) antiporter subunit G [Nesterenkonia pannonica]